MILMRQRDGRAPRVPRARHGRCVGSKRRAERRSHAQRARRRTRNWRPGLPERAPRCDSQPRLFPSSTRPASCSIPPARGSPRPDGADEEGSASAAPQAAPDPVDGERRRRRGRRRRHGRHELRRRRLGRRRRGRHELRQRRFGQRRLGRRRHGGTNSGSESVGGGGTHDAVGDGDTSGGFLEPRPPSFEGTVTPAGNSPDETGAHRDAGTDEPPAVTFADAPPRGIPGGGMLDTALTAEVGPLLDPAGLDVGVAAFASGLSVPASGSRGR